MSKQDNTPNFSYWRSRKNGEISFGTAEVYSSWCDPSTEEEYDTYRQRELLNSLRRQPDYPNILEKPQEYNVYKIIFGIHRYAPPGKWLASAYYDVFFLGETRTVDYWLLVDFDKVEAIADHLTRDCGFVRQNHADGLIFVRVDNHRD